MGKWGRCMIFGVEVGCTESDRATTGPIDISGICGVSGSVPTANTYILTDSVKKGAKFHAGEYRSHNK